MTSEHYYYGLGRRKAAVARVRLYPGTGTVVVNGAPLENVVFRASARQDLLRPLAVTDTLKRFNVNAGAKHGTESTRRTGTLQGARCRCSGRFVTSR